MNGGGQDPVNTSTLNSQYQKQLEPILSSMLAEGIAGGLPQFPGYDKVSSVYDPAITEQYFKDVFVTPTMRQLSGPYGAIPRIGAAAAQRGVYHSSGREFGQAEAASEAYSGLANAYAGLQNQDMEAMYNEWLRRDPLTNQLTKQAVNYLGTPMTVTYQGQPSPWGALLGSGLGMGLGALLAAPTGGLSMGMGAMLGGQLGGSIGGAVYH